MQGIYWKLYIVREVLYKAFEEFEEFCDIKETSKFNPYDEDFYIEYIVKLIQCGEYTKVKNYIEKLGPNNEGIIEEYLFNNVEMVRNYKGNNESKIILGKLYYHTGQYQKAEEILSAQNDADGLFLIGTMYESGYGKMKDNKLALEYYKRAKYLGHVQAVSKYSKIKARLDEEARKIEEEKNTSYSSSTSYSSYSSSSSSSSSSWCFITTAAYEYLGKDDECIELMTLRNFRDTYIASLEDGEKLIYEYYKIAPSIVEEIAKEEDPKEVYLKLWNEKIFVAYENILKGDNHKAMEVYRGMVINLKNKYLAEK